MASDERSLRRLLLETKAAAGLLSDEERDGLLVGVGEGLFVEPRYTAEQWVRRFGGERPGNVPEWWSELLGREERRDGGPHPPHVPPPVHRPPTTIAEEPTNFTTLSTGERRVARG